MEIVKLDNATVHIFKSVEIDGVEVITNELHYREGFLYVIVYDDGSKVELFKTKKLTKDEIEHQVYMCDY